MRDTYLTSGTLTKSQPTGARDVSTIEEDPPTWGIHYPEQRTGTYRSVPVIHFHLEGVKILGNCYENSGQILYILFLSINVVPTRSNKFTS